MKYRKAVFIVTHAKTKKEIEYLILKRKLHWKGWEFPKGGIKFLETKKGAVERELKEETGLNPLKIKKFKLEGRYRYHRKLNDRKGFVGQSFQLYATEVKKSKVIFGHEHSDYKWVGFKEALKKLRWPNQRKSLKIVNTWLKNEL